MVGHNVIEWLRKDERAQNKQVHNHLGQSDLYFRCWACIHYRIPKSGLRVTLWEGYGFLVEIKICTLNLSLGMNDLLYMSL